MQFLDFPFPVLIGCYSLDIWKAIQLLPDHAGVYLITETRLNKQYIGSSIKVRSRALGHMHPNSSTFKKLLFLESNPKYFKFELLEDCNGIDIKGLRQRESHWINEKDTAYPNGLNVNSPQKGAKFYSSTLYYDMIKGVNTNPCYQLLKFSERMDYYIEMVRKTPVNKQWFISDSLLNGMKSKRAAFKNLTHAEIDRPFVRNQCFPNQYYYSHL